ncbi:Bgr_08870 family protein [Bartonella sp. ML70XJBT.G]|uniref:Bgr_08870 family protein n=1 Tax=Bartonella sp. ML70XJBT.G TaxID=3019093 RepID=UPI002361F28A|nr:Bgr_08870 family protein [Bartonella sp. ML70XJBT.G]
MAKTKKLQIELPQKEHFISSEFPTLRESLIKIDQAIADIEGKIDKTAPLQHTHTIHDITDLETTLKSKMAADKTFTLTDLRDVEGAQEAANNYVLYKAGNNHFTFGSVLSLLDVHQHKTEDIIGLENAYGRLAHTNEWQAANDFKGKVTLSNTIELSQTASLILKQNGTIVTQLSTKGSALKGPATVDGKEIYTKTEATAALQDIHNKIEKITKITTHIPLEILITESGTLPWPEGTTDDTDIEIWAWGAGGGGGGGDNSICYMPAEIPQLKSATGENSVQAIIPETLTARRGGGGGGGGCARIQVKGSQLKSAKNVQIGCGGKGGKNTMGGNGGQTIIPGLLTAGGGGGGGSNCRGNYSDASYNYSGGGSGGNSNQDSYSYNGANSTFGGGSGGNTGSKTDSDSNSSYNGNGGISIFGGGGGGSNCDGHNPRRGQGGISGKGGNGGNGDIYSDNGGGGGGGGYFPGENGTIEKGGDGGNGAVLLRFFI